MTDDDRLAGLAAASLDIYQRNAARFDAERGKTLYERGWLERWLAPLPPGAALLDLGCGSGEPIARYLLERGYRVTGLDGAAAMLALARERLPALETIHADMRGLDLGRHFDGILAWDSFFHLRADEQRALLPRLARHLAPGGGLMLTVGPAAGEVAGRVGDDAVYHASLAPSEYAALLERHGLRLTRFVAEDPDCGGRTVLIARAGGLNPDA